jgi:tRNA threonylcarbamoyladenosine biosynthesis protein TsaB
VRVLGIETATRVASVGIADADGILAERVLPMQGSHARTLVQLIDETLAAAACALSDIELLAVSIGPGSFTGLRVGLSVAKGLGLAAGLPLVGVPTLDAYAEAAGSAAGMICPVLDARKGEVYGAAFQRADGTLQRVLEPSAMPPARFADAVQTPCTVIGDGVDAYEALWRRALGVDAVLVPFAALPPSGAVVARCGGIRAERFGADDLDALEPAYCRPSQAELGHPSGGAVRDDAATTVPLQARLGVAGERSHVGHPAAVEKLTGGRG